MKENKTHKHTSIQKVTNRNTTFSTQSVVKCNLDKSVVTRTKDSHIFLYQLAWHLFVEKLRELLKEFGSNKKPARIWCFYTTMLKVC
jgi:hypothetical protein